MVLIILKHYQQIADTMWKLVLKMEKRLNDSLSHNLGASCPPVKHGILCITAVDLL